MNWHTFKESEKEYPEKIVELSIDGFSHATNQLADMFIKPVDTISKAFDSTLGFCDFIFSLYLKSQFVPNYLFKVLTIGYNIELAPIYLKIEDALLEEFLVDKEVTTEYLVIEDEKELAKTLNKVFSSKKFEEIVSGVMKIAKRNLEKIERF